MFGLLIFIGCMLFCVFYVLNLTDKNLTDDEFIILFKGLNFCPSPKEPNSGDLIFGLNSLHRRLGLYSHFNDMKDLSPFPTP